MATTPPKKNTVGKDLNRDGVVNLADDITNDLDRNGRIDASDQKSLDRDSDNDIDATDRNLKNKQGQAGAKVGDSLPGWKRSEGGWQQSQDNKIQQQHKRTQGLGM